MPTRRPIVAAYVDIRAKASDGSVIAANRRSSGNSSNRCRQHLLSETPTK